MPSMSKHFKIGCSGFYNKHWKEVFYPEKMPAKDWLNYYSEHLNTVEINATFYRFPTLKSLQGWYNKTPDNFTLSVKVPKTVTHINKFDDSQSIIDDFYAVCQEGLQYKLGCVLFQLPPSIHFSEEKLEQIIKSLHPDFKNVIEFRHPSWWKSDVYDRLKKHNIIFCTVSHPTMPETLVVNSDIVYIRLHGTPKMFYSNYSEEYLKDLHEKLLQHTHLRDAYIYFNNTAGTAGIINAQQLTAMF